MCRFLRKHSLYYRNAFFNILKPVYIYTYMMFERTVTPRISVDWSNFFFFSLFVLIDFSSLQYQGSVNCGGRWRTPLMFFLVLPLTLTSLFILHSTFFLSFSRKFLSCNISQFWITANIWINMINWMKYFFFL